ncbi:hypothetical protein QJS10_CPA01g00178 [Acorus calamus]|uniref:Uncharacterized protein n=1 Tax=Acorus calamus TaxID=4465 RepID=A0AAV9FMC1_ACOCL|nr:hypothetical protein QJS10_CPA01g00178 [Acorus calamus]
MSDPYKKAKAGRLTFKGGDLATVKSIDKHNKKKKKHKKHLKAEEGEEVVPADAEEAEGAEASAAPEGDDVYTIDAAKKMKYDELFPVEARKFGYTPKSADFKTVEDALDDRVKKKADRYCK